MNRDELIEKAGQMFFVDSEFPKNWKDVSTLAADFALSLIPDYERLVETLKKGGYSILNITTEDLAALADDHTALKAWKESALSIEQEWNVQALAKMLGAQLGESCRKVIAEKVPLLIAENAALRERLARHEKCCERIAKAIGIESGLQIAAAAVNDDET